MRESQLLLLALVMTAASIGGYGKQQGSLKNRTFQSAGKDLSIAYLDRLYPSAHAANLLLLNNGDVLCFWFSGTAEGESNVGILMARLSRGEGTWSQPKLIDRQAGESFQNPVGFQDNTGRIWLFHTAQAAGQGQAHARVMELVSFDGGGSWSEPKVVFTGPGSFTRQPMVVTDDGSWLLPIFFTPSGDIVAGAESNYSVVMLPEIKARLGANAVSRARKAWCTQTYSSFARVNIFCSSVAGMRISSTKPAQQMDVHGRNPRRLHYQTTMLPFKPYAWLTVI